ncbi:glycosyltransferase family 4 protein [Microaerobacter geothermalis]|uniref:glycosyltransferase n=1 Tax=Microaerobacter geothermalis TaxID=674972 RepID=UPI001F1F190A|nr:glycosyltransferase [Microaerobacter geothermalis]MCF6094148.1 glycosyltransferase family 4 protein [Microaerobacter geothermalis]
MGNRSWDKIILATPYLYQHRGNSITAKRLFLHLSQLDLSVEVFPYLEGDLTSDHFKDRFCQSTNNEKTIIHVLNGYRFALWQRENKIPPLKVPYLVTMTGTDVNYDIFDPAKREIMRPLLENAQWVTVFIEEQKDKMIEQFPSLTDKVIVIPQGVWISLPEEKIKEKYLKEKEGDVHFFLPAGLRPVKNVLFPLKPFQRLHEKYSCIRLTLAGTKLIEDIYRQVKMAERMWDWFFYAGEVPFEKMPEWYLQSDVLLNTSLSEGQSMAIMEGMAAGLPVLASDIPGNRSLVVHGGTGYLYQNEDEFYQLAERLILDPELRKSMGNKGRERMNQLHSPLDEAKRYLYLYESI